MKVLVVGGGAREHALARAFSRDPQVTDIFCAPGNAGTSDVAVNRKLDVASNSDIVALVHDLDVDLAVIGPEGPLVAGAADAVRDSGATCFGPSAEAAKLEGSKTFAKEVMTVANVPTARSRACQNATQVAAALQEFGPPYVVKHDGLAAGKGVVVTNDIKDAERHAGTARRVVVEEFLDGPEVSLFCVTDGNQVVPLAPAQDYKRIGDDDIGPNTGGMGAYSPLSWLPEGFVDDVLSTVAQPTIETMRRRGTPFVGLLYIGLALTSHGVRVVEFNARFGDPETQVVLARLQSPLAPLLQAAARGDLSSVEKLRWSPDAAVNVVIAASGYPDSPRTGDRIDGLTEANRVDGVEILHAATSHDDIGNVVSAGGRVLSVVATAADLPDARARAYRAIAQIHLTGAQYRTDIAAEAGSG